MKFQASLGAATLVSLLVGGPVLAGGLNQPVEAPVVAPVIAVTPPAPVVADWSGFYAGLSYGAATGEANIYESGELVGGPLDIDGNLPALFGGYNLQRGNLVFGGELAIGLDGAGGESPGGEHGFDNVIDAKARVGYAFGNLLAYGALGYSVADFDDNGEAFDASGLGYGAGVQYQFGGRYFAGLEYYARDLGGDWAESDSVSLDETNLDTISLRVGMQF